MKNEKILVMSYSLKMYVSFVLSVGIIKAVPIDTKFLGYNNIHDKTQNGFTCT